MRLLSIIILLVTISGCTRTNDSSQAMVDKVDTLIVTDNIVLDSLDFNILKYDTSYHYIFPNEFKGTDLSEKEVKECEALLVAYIANYNTGEARRRFDEVTRENPDLKFNLDDFTIDLKDYGRQFIAGISDNGTKIVFVNCFCEPEKFNSRNKELVFVSDGGNCFFNFKVNLTEKKIFDFMENGVA